MSASVVYASLHGAVVITTGVNDVIRLDEAGTIHSATIAPDTYYLRGDNSTHDLCKGVKDALDGAFGSANVYTVSISNGSAPLWSIDPAARSAGVRISAAGGVNWRVKWADGSATFDPLILGFTATKSSADTAAETGTESPTCLWVGSEVYRERKRSFHWTIGANDIADGNNDLVRRSDKAATHLLQMRFTDERRVFESANTSHAADTFEAFLDLHNDGRPMELHERSLQTGSSSLLADPSSSTLVATVRFEESTASDLDPARIEPGLALYDFDLAVREVV